MLAGHIAVHIHICTSHRLRIDISAIYHITLTLQVYDLIVENVTKNITAAIF